MRFQKSILMTGLSLMAFVAFGQQPVVQIPKSKNGFIVISHRASHLVKPENTIAAIDDAIRLGADYVELDVRTTKDGHLVLNHNETVDARTNGKGAVRDLTWAEISDLKVNGNDGGIYHIPDLAAALKACKNKVNIYLDFKDADVAETYRQIKAFGMEKNILVYINKGNHYDLWRKIAPQMPLMSGLPETVKTKEDVLDFCSKMQLEAVDNAKDMTLITALNENGVHVFLDAQSKDENPESWKLLIDKGVQGLQTDHPEALITYLKTSGQRNGSTVNKVKYPKKKTVQ